MLVPMNDTIFGDPISEEAFDDLTLLFNEVAAEFQEDLGDTSGELYREQKNLTAKLAQKPKLHFMVTVTAAGPDCKELEVGDTAVLPPQSGTMVTIIDEVTNEPRRVFAISERVVLAR